MDELSDKGRRTRARLTDAARRVFERDGFIESRIADIVKEAGAAYGTFYTYFPSKEAVFLAVIEAQQGEIEEAAKQAAAGRGHSARSAIEASNRAYLEGYGRNWRLMESWSEAASVDREIGSLLEELTLFNIERTERALIHLKERGDIAADIDPHYAARALNAMVTQFSIRIFRDNPVDVDVDVAVRTVTDLWCRGIGLRPNASE
ncbi:TetR/AcrR family transcriptional regulator [Gordonia sp. NB41Y]|uniref:TetR/AcrR family transcriptional regulator n=1 Tax=Gordonia sp. NB41Y TaxID=875808 RepID=UPI001364BC59|nr:TetR/AcrR family transcriptional regulator [Gordonia sp. NB41Y]WLP92936.1 TetR/AcrR family transcriptional regulator [Gordonia sp. NB41Y]